MRMAKELTLVFVLTILGALIAAVGTIAMMRCHCGLFR